MNPLAVELNKVLDTCAAGSLLSALGRRLYFPKGIIAQSSEAKKSAAVANATIGMANQNGRPIMLKTLQELLPESLAAEEIVAYAPTAGLESVRELWKKELLRKNPSITSENSEFISLPVVVPGITAGLFFAADLFLDENSTILSNYPSWDNYKLIFADRHEANFKEIPFFSGKEGESGLDLPKITDAIRQEAKTGSVRIILNFPNNPTGYSPTEAECAVLVDCLKEVADGGANVLVINDDAYFGLFYEAETRKESLFASLCGAHERIVAVKTDGPTKEDYSWGFRVAMVTFGGKGLKKEHLDALVTKLTGAIRSSVSCSNTLSQNLYLKITQNKKTLVQKEEFFNTLKGRYLAFKKFIGCNCCPESLHPLPFNSGYFMSFRCTAANAMELRNKLLYEHGIGTIAIDKEHLRVAFSSLEEAQIPAVLQTIYNTANGL